MKLSMYFLITVSVGKRTRVLLSPLKCVRASLRGLFVHSMGTKTQMDCEFCVYRKPSLLFCLFSFCWGQQWVSKHSGVWHPDAAWISGQRLSVHREGEGGPAPRLKACLFDMAFPRHLTALSVFPCKAGRTLSFRAYTATAFVCLCFLRYVCVFPQLHT